MSVRISPSILAADFVNLQRELGRIATGGLRLFEREAHESHLGIRVRAARDGQIVGRDRVAERHAHRGLALVVGDVRVHFRAGGITHQPLPLPSP